MARFDKFGEFLLEKNVVTRKALSGLLASQRLVRDKIGTIAVKVTCRNFWVFRSSTVRWKPLKRGLSRQSQKKWH